MRHELTVQSRWKDRPPSHEESSESRWPDSLPMNLFEWINVVVMWWEGLLLMIRSLILIPSSATNLAVWSWLSHLWTSVFLIVKTGNDEDLQGSQHPIMKFYVSMTHEEESGERRDSLVPLLWGGRGRKYRERKWTQNSQVFQAQKTPHEALIQKGTKRTWSWSRWGKGAALGEEVRELSSVDLSHLHCCWLVLRLSHLFPFPDILSSTFLYQFCFSHGPRDRSFF